MALDEDEVNEALRRAVVVRAVGGDPQRELSLDDDAVTRLAAELDAPEHREQLRTALLDVGREAGGRPRVEAGIAALVADPDRAWRAFSAALLARALDDEA